MTDLDLDKIQHRPSPVSVNVKPCPSDPDDSWLFAGELVVLTVEERDGLVHRIRDYQELEAALDESAEWWKEKYEAAKAERDAYREALREHAIQLHGAGQALEHQEAVCLECGATVEGTASVHDLEHRPDCLLASVDTDTEAGDE